LKHFKSVEKIKKASYEDLVIIAGKSIAGKVYRHFHADNME